jgi:hypothetical protein
MNKIKIPKEYKEKYGDGVFNQVEKGKIKCQRMEMLNWYYKKKVNLINDINKQLKKTKRLAEKNKADDLKKEFDKITGKGLYYQFAHDINLYKNFNEKMTEFLKEKGLYDDYSKVSPEEVKKDIEKVAKQIPKEHLVKMKKDMEREFAKIKTQVPKFKKQSFELARLINEFGWFFAAWTHLIPLLIQYGLNPSSWVIEEKTGPSTHIKSLVSKGNNLQRILFNLGLYGGKGLSIFKGINEDNYKELISKSFDLFIEKFEELKGIIKDNSKKPK